jgi:MFS family permease
VSTADQSRARRVVGFVFLTVFLDLVGFGIIIPLFPFYVTSMRGGSPDDAGYILGAFAATQLVATPFLGRLSDRVGRRRVILISLAGNALSMVLFALASQWRLLWLLYASRISAGATAGNLAACQAAVADVTTAEERAKGMGLVGAGIGLGMILGPVIGGSVARLGAWAPPLAAAALAFADLIGAFFLMPETTTNRASSSTAPKLGGTSLRAALTQRAIATILALYFLTFLYMTNIQASLSFLANLRLQWTAEAIGHVFGLFGAIMFVVQGFLIGRMARLWGERNIVIAGSLSSMLGLLLIAAAQATVPLVAGLVLLGLGLGVINPCLSTLASESAPTGQQGAILGFAQSAGGLARTVGPVLSTHLYEHIAPGAPFVVGAGAAFVSVVLGFSLLVRKTSQLA